MSIKTFLCILTAVMIFFSAHSQTITPVREIYVNENSVGDIKFIQGDFDQDGDVEFVADANHSRNYFIGAIAQDKIITERSGTPLDADTDFVDLRYEDTDGDGQNEMYVQFEEGLVRLDTNTLLPLDTILMPGSSALIHGIYILQFKYKGGQQESRIFIKL